MEIEVIRRHFKETYTIGKLYIDKFPFCDTLEDTVRDLKDLNNDGDFDDPGEGKIYGETAIPCGRYPVIVTYSPKFGKRLPELFRVPGFRNIRIHAGSNPKHTEGCILIGENRERGRLVNGPYYQTQLVQMMDDLAESNEHCYITVKE